MVPNLRSRLRRRLTKIGSHHLRSNERRRAPPTLDTLEIGFTSDLLDPPSLRDTILFVGSAARTDGHSIGFLPFQAYEEAHAQRRLVTLTRNSDRVGFLLFSINAQRECRILQIWVRTDARLILHGRLLVDFVNDRAAWPAGCWTMRLWCAEDLAANAFWQALGFLSDSWRWGPAKRARRHRLWRRPVTPSTWPLQSRPDALRTA